MGSGIIQIVSIGRQNKELNDKPTYTPFIKTFKRHTVFASESMPINFAYLPNFNNRVSCDIKYNYGDLMGKTYFRTVLPALPSINNSITYAWKKNIGYKLIKYIEFEVNGLIIEKLHGDWLETESILNTNDSMKDALNIMIGNVPELTNFTKTKNEYLLIIPITFFYTKFTQHYFPVVSLSDANIKINIELNKIEDCLEISPTHKIGINDDICLLNKGDEIYQYNNTFIFDSYDILSKTIYYKKRNNNSSINIGIVESSVNNVMLSVNSLEKSFPGYYESLKIIKTLNLGISFMIIDLIILGPYERSMFVKKRIDNVISVIENTNEKSLLNSNECIKLNFPFPCSEIILKHFKRDNLSIDNISVLNNGNELINKKSFKYYNIINCLKLHESIDENEEIGVINFTVDKTFLSGYINILELGNVELRVKFNKKDNFPVLLKIYSRTLRYLVIENGEIKFI